MDGDVIALANPLPRRAARALLRAIVRPLASASVLMTNAGADQVFRYESVTGVQTGIRISLVLGCASALLIVLLLRGAVVHLNLGLGFQGAQLPCSCRPHSSPGLQALYSSRDAAIPVSTGGYGFLSR